MSPKKRSMIMAFTRKFLSSLGIDDDKVDTIITAHTEVTDALKEERDKYKADAEKLSDVQKELNKALEKSDDGYKEKYNDLVKEYDDYKQSISAEKEQQKKSDAYKKLLIDAGVAEKRLATVLKVDADIISKLEFDDHGEIKDADKIKDTVKSEWADFITQTEEHGTDPATPPTNSGGGMSREEIMKIKDTSARQKAIAENLSVFEK